MLTVFAMARINTFIIMYCIIFIFCLSCVCPICDLTATRICEATTTTEEYYLALAVNLLLASRLPKDLETKNAALNILQLKDNTGR
jgi:hypothetical protein